MLITVKHSISQADYNRYKDLTNIPKEELDQFFGWRAHFSAYPPAGYGMNNPRVEMIDNDYYMVWECRDNCD